MNIGETLLKIRRERGHYNMRKLCRDNGLDQSHLCRMEGNKKRITIAYMQRLAEIYEVPMGIIFYLATDESDIKSPEKLAAFKALKPLLDKLIQDTFLIRVL